MSKMSNMIDTWLGLETDETISDCIRDTTMLKRFKQSISNESGYRGAGMCMRCSARVLIRNENWCTYYSHTCKGIAGRCTGTK